MSKYVKVIAALLVFVALNTRGARGQDELSQGIEQLATKIAETARGEQKRRVAIVDFARLDGSVSAFGQHLAEALVTEMFLVAPDRFEVVERRYLNLVLKEQKLTANQLFDPQSLSQVGSFLGVDEIVTGTVSDIGDQVEINIRLISVESGMITGADRVRLRKLGAIEILMGQGVVRASGGGQAAGGAVAGGKDAGPIGRGIISDGVVIELMSLRRSGDGVLAECFVTSGQKDVELIVQANYGGKTRVIDENGIESIGSQVTFGQKTEGRYVQKTLVRGVRTKVQITFNGVSPDAQSIALLEVAGQALVSSWRDWKHQFRNVPIE